MLALRYMNKQGCHLAKDSVLMGEAKKISTYFTDTTRSEELESRFYYGTPLQKYIIFASVSKDDYSGWDIPPFLADNDKLFFDLVQYKYNVGVWADERRCIIVFYKNKNVITLATK
jgi:hypothetical protein